MNNKVSVHTASSGAELDSIVGNGVPVVVHRPGAPQTRVPRGRMRALLKQFGGVVDVHVNHGTGIARIERKRT